MGWGEGEAVFRSCAPTKQPREWRALTARVTGEQVFMDESIAGFRGGGCDEEKIDIARNPGDHDRPPVRDGGADRDPKIQGYQRSRTD